MIRFLDPSWAVIWSPKLLRRRKREAQGHHKVAFLLLFARVLACRLSCFFEASWGPFGALVVPIWPRRHDFLVPEGFRNDHQNDQKSDLGKREPQADGAPSSEATYGPRGPPPGRGSEGCGGYPCSEKGSRLSFYMLIYIYIYHPLIKIVQYIYIHIPTKLKATLES